MTKDGAEFLGFIIRAGKARNADSNNSNIIGKPYPNMKKLSAKITKICGEIHKMKHMKQIGDRVAQIQYINSMIIGIAEYIKISICSKAYSIIDHKIYVSCYYTWKRLYPNNVMKMKIPLNLLSNIPHRHKGYTTKTHAVRVQNMWIGITKAFITHSQWEKLPMNQKITPYTMEGRKLYFRNQRKQEPMSRPSINTADSLRLSFYTKSIYNFEYFMNREYAFNRDKGKCRCCGCDLMSTDKHCHHINRKLSPETMNKVSNLAWLCRNCHIKIHSFYAPVNIDSKVKQKIMQFRKKLDNVKSISKSYS